MIANRFKSVGRVLGCAVAAMGLYLVTSQVAAERTELERVNRQILSAKKDIRRLHTELGTRANLRQLERWNGEVLALTTPDADQFLQGEVQLAALDRSGITPGPRYAPTTMVTAMVSIPDEAMQQVAAEAAKPAAQPAVETMPVTVGAARKPLTSPAPRVEKAIAVAPVKADRPKPAVAKLEKAKPAPAKVELARADKPKPVAPKPAVAKAKSDKDKKLARLEDKLLDDRLMGEIGKRARAEGGRARPQ